MSFVPLTAATTITATGTYLSSAATVGLTLVDSTTATCTRTGSTQTTVTCTTPAYVLPANAAKAGAATVKATVGGASSSTQPLELIGKHLHAGQHQGVVGALQLGGSAAHQSSLYSWHTEVCVMRALI